MTAGFDVVLLADPHTSLAPALDLAAEIRTLAAAGYTVGLLDADDLAGTPSPAFHEAVRRCIRDGSAALLPPRAPAHARLAIVRAPAAWVAPADAVAVTAETWLAVADEPTTDAALPYRLEHLAPIARGTSRELRWAAAGALARTALDGVTPEIDWPRVIDVDGLLLARRLVEGGKPATGRIAGTHPDGWPRTARDLRAAYPDDPAIGVRILGDVTLPLRTLRGTPEHWRVHPPGSLRARDLYARIAFYVDQPARDARLGPGRSLLEAIASGAVAIVPRTLADALGEAAVVAEPGEVRDVVTALAADRSAYDARVRAGRDAIRARHGPEAYLRRVAALAGPPTGRPSSTPQRRPAQPTRRILFVSSNGAGVGHLMRLMSLARRASPEVEPVFFTMSQAVQAVRQMGFPIEYLASHHYARLPGSLWHPHLRQRIAALLALHKPSAVVFDGTAPYRGLVQAMRAHPHLPFIWSRRAMWKPGLGDNALKQAGAFHLVIEPGDFAEQRDAGATVALREGAVRAGPVTFHDPDEALPAGEAKAQLGLDPGRPAVLVQLGAGNINDISSALAVVLRRLAREDGLQVCAASSIIGIRRTPAFAHVKQISVYPLARYLRAFDFAVTAAGYNTYHEVIAAGVPAIFVPNLDTALDDQAARAAHAEETGVGMCLEHVDDASFDRCVSVLLDPDRRAAMAWRARELFPPNGAPRAMRAIEDFVAAWEDSSALRPVARRERRGRRSAAAPGGARDASFTPARPKSPAAAALRRLFLRATRRPRNALKRRLRLARLVLGSIDATAARGARLPVTPGPDLDIVESAWQPVVMIQVWQPADEALEEVVARVHALQRTRRTFRPLFVTDSDAFWAFRRHGYLFEYVMPREAWDRLDHPIDWPEYRWRRIALLTRTYRPEHVVAGSTWEQLEPSLLGAVLDAAPED